MWLLCSKPSFGFLSPLVKSKVLPWPTKSCMIGIPISVIRNILPLSPRLSPLQFLNALLPQSFCLCYSLCLKCSSPKQPCSSTPSLPSGVCSTVIVSKRPSITTYNTHTHTPLSTPFIPFHFSAQHLSPLHTLQICSLLYCFSPPTRMSAPYLFCSLLCSWYLTGAWHIVAE